MEGFSERVLTFLMDAISSMSTFVQPSSMAVDEHGEEDEFQTPSFCDELLQRLPEDVVVMHIFGRLDFATRVRLSAVSRPWRRLSGLSPPPLDMPWLILKTDGLSSTYALRNLTLNTTHRPRAGCMAIANYFVPGGSRGQYLVLISRTLKGASGMLYNPFTGDCTALPSRNEASGWPGRELNVAHLSCDPTPSNLRNNCCVVAALDCAGNLYICRPRDSHWIRLHYVENNFDVLFFKGELYCINRGANVVALPVRDIDTADPRILTDISSIADPRVIIKGKQYLRYTIYRDQTYMQLDMLNIDHYLVESCGELLVVTRYESRMGCRVLGDRIEGVRFSVERVVEEEGQMEQVDDLGDRMLFVQKGGSKSWSGLGQRPAFFEENCIYFVWKMESESSCFRLGKFPLSTKGEGGSSFVVLHPNPLPSLSSPIWITPNPSST